MSVRLAYPNLAVDPEMRRKVEDELVPLLVEIRKNRIPMDEKNQRLYRIWNCELDQYSYAGRSKIFLPAARSAAETWVSSLSRDLFPIDEWFRVTSIDEVSSEDTAETFEALLKYFWQKQVNLKSLSNPSIRQLVSFGTSPNKVYWKNLERAVQAIVKNWNPRSGKWQADLEDKVVKFFYGPDMRVVDLMRWFIWPETVNNVDEAVIVFEDIETTIGHIKEQANIWVDEKDHSKGHIYEVEEEVYSSESSRDSNVDLTQSRKERLHRLGITNDPSDRWNKLTENRRNISECYWNVDIDGTGEKPWLLGIVNDRYVIRIQENPYFKKRSMYVVPRLITVTNEFYGHGILELVDRIQYMFNDVCNQTLDSVQYEVNPITIIDPAKVSFHQSIKRVPGAHWLADPSGISFTQPSMVSQIGFQTLQILQGFIQDFSANAALQGQPAVRGRGRAQATAVGMQQMLSQGSAPIQEVVENLCHEYTEPILQISYELIEQFMEESVLIRVLGKKAGKIIQRRVDLVDVIGNYEFHWLGAISTRNRMILGQQMINFANIARGFPPQILATMNWPWLAKKIWSEGMGLRDAEEMFNPQGPLYSIDPRLELEMIKENREVQVSPGDDPMGHLKQHMTDITTLKDPDQIDRLNEHIQKTKDQIMQIFIEKQKQQLMMQMQRQQMMAQQGPQSKPQNAKPQTQPSGMGFDGLASLGQQLQTGMQ